MKIIGRKIKLTKAVKASIAFFIASIVTSGISYLVTPIYTNLLTTDEYGKTSVFMTWLQVFGIVAMFCLSYGVFNNGMCDYPDKRDDYSFSMLILSNIITLAFFGVLLAVYPLISQFLKLEIPLILLMLAVCFFQPAMNFWVTRQRYEYKYKAVFIWSLIRAVLSPLTAVVLMLNTSEGSRLYPRIFGAECSLIVIYIGFYVYLGIRNKWKINTKYWKQAFLFNLPLILHYLSTYLLGSSDKIMISHLVSDSATAFYSVAYSIAAIAAILWSAINSSLIPYTYEKCKENKLEDINKVTLPLMALFAVGCVIVIMLAPEAVRIMATNDYMEAIYVIPPVVGGVFFQVQYYIYANIVYYYKKPKYVMIGSLTAVVLNIVLNYIFIKQWGYMAAGYTTLFCYAVQALIDYIAMRKVVGRSVYNMKVVIALSAAVVAVSIASVFVYDNTIVRYSILSAVIILIIVFRKKIIAALKFRNRKQPSAEKIMSEVDDESVNS